MLSRILLQRKLFRIKLLGHFPLPNDFAIDDLFDGVRINVSIGSFLYCQGAVNAESHSSRKPARESGRYVGW